MYGWRRIIDNVNIDKIITVHTEAVIDIEANGVNSSY